MNNRQDMEFEGILLVDKPQGITSHDVVDRLRRKLRMKKIGHAGTLDPLATGLLIMLIGKDTKVPTIKEIYLPALYTYVAFLILISRGSILFCDSKLVLLIVSTYIRPKTLSLETSIFIIKAKGPHIFPACPADHSV